MSHRDDRAPGDQHRGSPRQAILLYLAGLALAAVLTAASFAVAGGWGGVWQEGIPVALVALAVGQMGVHLVFFLHISTGPDNVNNTMALAFGILIVGLVLGGSLWIMGHLSHHLMTAETMAQMQR